MGNKTGAVVCKRNDPETGMHYIALLFILDVPAEVSDADLQEKPDFSNLISANPDCEEVLYRADILSTTNEVQEQFEQLHILVNPTPVIRYEELKQKQHAYRG